MVARIAVSPTATRPSDKWPELILVRTSIRASWLKQIEIYLSIAHRKLLTPSDLARIRSLKRGLTPSKAATNEQRRRSDAHSSISLPSFLQGKLNQTKSTKYVTVMADLGGLSLTSEMAKISPQLVPYTP
jgi:hypothetical protein